MRDSRSSKLNMLIFRRKSMPTLYLELRNMLASMFYLTTAAVKALNLALAIQHLITCVTSIARSTSFATAYTLNLLKRLSKNKSETS